MLCLQNCVVVTLIRKPFGCDSYSQQAASVVGFVEHMWQEAMGHRSCPWLPLSSPTERIQGVPPGETGLSYCRVALRRCCNCVVGRDWWKRRRMLKWNEWFTEWQEGLHFSLRSAGNYPSDPEPSPNLPGPGLRIEAACVWEWDEMRIKCNPEQ